MCANEDATCAIIPREYILSRLWELSNELKKYFVDLILKPFTKHAKGLKWFDNINNIKIICLPQELHSIIKPILRPITRSSIQFSATKNNQDTLVNNKKTLFAFVNKDNLIDLCSRKWVVIAYDDTHKIDKGSNIKLYTACFLCQYEEKDFFYCVHWLCFRGEHRRSFGTCEERM